MEILVEICTFMATPDLPLYGQIFAYGIGLAGIGFGLKQIVGAIGQLQEILKRWRENLP